MKEAEIKFPIEIEHYERKIYDLKQLIEISKGLNSTLEYNTLIDSILLTCMGQMQLLKSGIFLKKGIDYNDFTLHRNYKGFEIDHSREYELVHSSKLIKFIEDKEKSFTLIELEEHVQDEKSLSILRLLEPLLVVPLISKGTLNGIIILGERINKVDFTELEKDFITTIASLAGIAIHNASLYEMATTDMMTKLKIHHYFQTTMIDEVERARKYKRPLSLIMLDIDNFKNFNDTYGHVAGDLVLEKVAQVLKDNIRLMDVAARYGGEEFAVILPKTDINATIIVAERIRKSIESEMVFYGDKELSVAVSVGVTQFDSEFDKNKNDFINRADKALYISKKNGKNMVSFL
ncbi:diguanylate cyclase DgcA [Spirochaetota bacterium]